MKFSPSGDHFASVGSDSKFFIYDGKTGDTVAEFTDSPHKGSIVGLFLFIYDVPFAYVLFVIEDLWLNRWLAIGVLTANRYSPHQLTVPSNFVRNSGLTRPVISLNPELVFFFIG